MDKVDGPYYFFPLLKLLRDRLPSWTPLVGLDLGDTNVVPVDYVARAMAWLAHVPRCDGQAFHLVDRKSTRLNSSHANISYAVFCLKIKMRSCVKSAFATKFNRHDRCAVVTLPLCGHYERYRQFHL